MHNRLLPIHGFVLAGGKSSRMGVDKATLHFRGQPMVEIAVAKLREFCADVSIAGNRDDLSCYAEVVHEARTNAGPAAGIEAGLHAATQEWVMFVPVDVPLVPAELLRRFATLVLEVSGSGLNGVQLHVEREQPAFCVLQRNCAAKFTEVLDAGTFRLKDVFLAATGTSHRLLDVSELYPEARLSAETIRHWFSNINTPEELVRVEAHAAQQSGNA